MTVIEVEALLLVGRDMDTDSHRDSLQLLPWQVARGWMEMAEGREGPDGFYPSLTHFAGCGTDGREVQAASCMANVWLVTQR